jgi:hypothetical protein
MSITLNPHGACGAPGALRGARRVRRAARRNGPTERRDRAAGRLYILPLPAGWPGREWTSRIPSDAQARSSCLSTNADPLST